MSSDVESQESVHKAEESADASSSASGAAKQKSKEDESSSSSSSDNSNETASVGPLSDSDDDADKLGSENEGKAANEDVEEEEEEDEEEQSSIVKSKKAQTGKKRSKKRGGAPLAKRKSSAVPKRKKGIPKVLVPDRSSDVEKFLASRMRDGKREFLVKHKHTSYWHLTWLPEPVLLEMSPHNKGRILRWVEANGEPDDRNLDAPETDYFNPNFREIDRIVSTRTRKGANEYLVKWRDLNYLDATWESQQEMEELKDWKEKLAAYEKRSRLPATTVKQPSQLRFDPNMNPPAFPEGRQLRPYQLEGFRWLVYSWIKGNKGILADEMGLGKTIQAIALLQWLVTVGHKGPFIVIAPLSTLGQWQREIEGWSSLNGLIYHGDAVTREIIHQYEWNFPRSTQVKFDVLVTSYEMVLAESARLSKVNWKYMILDEGHRIKNTQAKVLVALSKFTAGHKLILTGTPLQNNMSELWSMLSFLDRDKFGNSSEFLAQYGDLQDAAQLAKLQQTLAPHFLRRMKEDVEKDLPVKEEVIIMVDLNSIQKAFYKAVLERNGEFLRRGTGVRAKLLNIFMELRKVCNHPFLLTGAEAQLTDGKTKQEAAEMLVTASSKMIFLDKLLRKLKDEGHKVLIFSQMTRQLDIIEDYLALRKYEYERMDGSHSQAQREASLRQFRKGSTFVFLLSTRAGGVGLNLTTADTVVIFDSDWNPQNDLQAQARCHRIGQTVPVKIYRLLTQDSYEKHMFEIASKKLGLATAVLGKREASEVVDGDTDLDNKELQQLLRFGAYQLFNSDINAEQATDKRIMDESLESILARAARVTYLDAGTEGPKVSFAKAAFDEVAAEVRLDDEAFWDKILPEFKSTRRFLAKLENVAEMKEEEKAMLMSAIPELVAEVKKLSTTRNFWASFDPMKDLAQLLALVASSNAFTEEQRAAARLQQEELLSSGRRHGRQAPSRMIAEAQQTTSVAPAAAGGANGEGDAEVMNAPDSSEARSSGDEHEEKKAGKKRALKEKKEPKEKKEKRDKKKPYWVMRTRGMFKTALMLYGWGRWETIKEASGLNRTPAQLQAFGEAYLCSLGLEPEHASVLREVKRQVLDKAGAMDAPEGPIDAEIEFNVAPSVVLQPDDVIQLTVTSPSNPTPAMLDKPLAAVLFLMVDKDSMPIRLITIPALNKPIAVHVPGFVGTYAARLVAGKKTYSYSENDVTFTVGRMTELLNEPPVRPSNMARLKTMRRVNRYAAIYTPEFRNLPSETIMPRGASPAPWWGEEFDRRLLAYVYRHGMRGWDAQLDPSSGLDDASIIAYTQQNGLPPPDSYLIAPTSSIEPPPTRMLPLAGKLLPRLERILTALDYFHSTVKKRETPAPSGPPQTQFAPTAQPRMTVPAAAVPRMTAIPQPSQQHQHTNGHRSSHHHHHTSNNHPRPSSSVADADQSKKPRYSQTPAVVAAVPAAAPTKPLSLVSSLAEKALGAASSPAPPIPVSAMAKGGVVVPGINQPRIVFHNNPTAPVVKPTAIVATPNPASVLPKTVPLKPSAASLSSSSTPLPGGTSQATSGHVLPPGIKSASTNLKLNISSAPAPPSSYTLAPSVAYAPPAASTARPFAPSLASRPTIPSPSKSEVALVEVSSDDDPPSNPPSVPPPMNLHLSDG